MAKLSSSEIYGDLKVNGEFQLDDISIDEILDSDDSWTNSDVKLGTLTLIDEHIDSLISTHASDGDAHHDPYTDADAISAVEGESTLDLTGFSLDATNYVSDILLAADGSSTSDSVLVTAGWVSNNTVTSSTLDDYLPLSAGSGNSLSGSLYLDNGSSIFMDANGAQFDFKIDANSRYLFRVMDSGYSTEYGGIKFDQPNDRFEFTNSDVCITDSNSLYLYEGSGSGSNTRIYCGSGNYIMFNTDSQGTGIVEYHLIQSGASAFSETYAGYFINCRNSSGGTITSGNLFSVANDGTNLFKVLYNGNAYLDSGNMYVRGPDVELVIRDTSHDKDDNDADFYPRILFKDSAGDTAAEMGFTNKINNSFYIELENVYGGNGFVINGSEAFYCDSIYDYTTSSGSYVRVLSSGLLRRYSSSIKYKTNVEDITVHYDTSKVFDLRPVSFTSLCEDDDKEKLRIGLIAEEVDEVFPELVNHEDPVYNDDGTLKNPDTVGDCSSVHYELLSVLLLEEVRKLRAEVEELKKLR